MADGAYFYKSDRYILNRCTKYLARFNTDRRHAYGTEDRPRDRIAEAWRFPIIDTYAGGAALFSDPTLYWNYNEVTFIYSGSCTHTPHQVAVVGTFSNFHDRIPLKRAWFD